jgi:hypothetical protein
MTDAPSGIPGHNRPRIGCHSPPPTRLQLVSQLSLRNNSKDSSWVFVMAQAILHLQSSTQPIRSHAKGASHGFRSAAELMDGINNLKIMHENHEQVRLASI